MILSESVTTTGFASSAFRSNIHSPEMAGPPVPSCARPWPHLTSPHLISLHLTSSRPHISSESGGTATAVLREMACVMCGFLGVHNLAAKQMHTSHHSRVNLEIVFPSAEPATGIQRHITTVCGSARKIL
ncbi:hypothetical protein CORC01_10279 [Colletotrichum orchidophilum]|uniref:Uncharacterized protein n=1 Tax=Colletotrichum orchidophilum TaxID=1209926 RepID=A0A1G4AZ64_9PEZI|nr:uncharacterized protein CORC01_10279 [Colletotrichum orchidophilum]OHE94460.1 hypothetical protein CORC01_10279 [Colletotrichum orchidophilum]